MGQQYKITAPNRTFNDVIGGVRFVDGVATTDDVSVIGYAQGAGYKVEPARAGRQSKQSEQGGEQPADKPADKADQPAK